MKGGCYRSLLHTGDDCGQDFTWLVRNLAVVGSLAACPAELVQEADQSLVVAQSLVEGLQLEKSLAAEVG